MSDTWIHLYVNSSCRTEHVGYKPHPPRGKTHWELWLCVVMDGQYVSDLAVLELLLPVLTY